MCKILVFGDCSTLLLLLNIDNDCSREEDEQKIKMCQSYSFLRFTSQLATVNVSVSK